MSTGAATLEPEALPSDTGLVPRLVRLRRVASWLAIASVAEALGIVILSSSGDDRFHLAPDLVSIGFLGIVVLFPVMGALIARQRPATRVAWLMIVLGLGVGLGLFSFAYGVVGTPPGPHAPLPLALVGLIASPLLFIPVIGPVTTWILLLYPTDRLIGPRWRWVGILSIVSAAAFIIGTLLAPTEFDPENLPGLVNPLGVPGEFGAAFELLAEVANRIGLAFLGLSVASLVVRYRRSDQIVRAQIRWLALVASLAITSFAVSLLPNDFVDYVTFGLGLTLAACMPIAIGIAITRYRLYDIDRLINRALVYGSLTAILAGVFTAAVGLAQRLFIAATGETSDAAIVGTTLVVATLYAPLRKRLEAIVDRWFKYDERRFGPYRDELTRLLSALEAQRAAQRLVREASRELRVVGIAVLDARGDVVASAGSWPTPVELTVTIDPRDALLRSLAIGPRADGQPLDETELALLGELVALVAEAARPRTGHAAGGAAEPKVAPARR